MTHVWVLCHARRGCVAGTGVLPVAVNGGNGHGSAACRWNVSLSLNRVVVFRPEACLDSGAVPVTFVYWLIASGSWRLWNGWRHANHSLSTGRDQALFLIVHPVWTGIVRGPDALANRAAVVCARRWWPCLSWTSSLIHRRTASLPPKIINRPIYSRGSTAAFCRAWAASGDIRNSWSFSHGSRPFSLASANFRTLYSWLTLVRKCSAITAILCLMLRSRYIISASMMQATPQMCQHNASVRNRDANCKSD